MCIFPGDTERMLKEIEEIKKEVNSTVLSDSTAELLRQITEKMKASSNADKGESEALRRERIEDFKAEVRKSSNWIRYQTDPSFENLRKAESDLEKQLEGYQKFAEQNGVPDIGIRVGRNRLYDFIEMYTRINIYRFVAISRLRKLRKTRDNLQQSIDRFAEEASNVRYKSGDSDVPEEEHEFFQFLKNYTSEIISNTREKLNKVMANVRMMESRLGIKKGYRGRQIIDPEYRRKRSEEARKKATEFEKKLEEVYT
jgi:hypothetical protein